MTAARYFVVTGDGFPAGRPLALRRVPRSGVLESYRRDGRWHPDPRVELLTGEADRDLTPITRAQAGRFRALWRPEAGP